jgi:hypothetical protein
VTAFTFKGHSVPGLQEFHAMPQAPYCIAIVVVGPARRCKQPPVDLEGVYDASFTIVVTIHSQVIGTLGCAVAA